MHLVNQLEEKRLEELSRIAKEIDKKRDPFDESLVPECFFMKNIFSSAQAGGVSESLHKGLGMYVPKDLSLENYQYFMNASISLSRCLRYRQRCLYHLTCRIDERSERDFSWAALLREQDQEGCLLQAEDIQFLETQMKRVEAKIQSYIAPMIYFGPLVEEDIEEIKAFSRRV